MTNGGMIMNKIKNKIFFFFRFLLKHFCLNGEKKPKLNKQILKKKVVCQYKIFHYEQYFPISTFINFHFH
jgi:hypothetical protein